MAIIQLTTVFIHKKRKLLSHPASFSWGLDGSPGQKTHLCLVTVSGDIFWTKPRDCVCACMCLEGELVSFTLGPMWLLGSSAHISSPEEPGSLKLGLVIGRWSDSLDFTCSCQHRVPNKQVATSVAPGRGRAGCGPGRQVLAVEKRPARSLRLSVRACQRMLQDYFPHTCVRLTLPKSVLLLGKRPLYPNCFGRCIPHHFLTD